MNTMQSQTIDPKYINEALIYLLTENHLPPTNVADNNYWFFRTQGGEYFQEFYNNGYIAMGWDDIPCLEEKDRTEEIKKHIKNDLNYGQPSRVLNQVYKFCHIMKKGDIVIIPSSGSANLAFGRILEDNHYEYQITDKDKENNKCPYTRRRKIKWLKISKRNLVDPKLFAFFRNQQALSKANDYAEFIERAINPFYIKDGIAHLNLSVKIKESPKATDIPYYLIGLNENMKLLAQELSLPLEEPEVRINVQSDGIIELISNSTYIFLAALTIVGIFGGGFRFAGFQLKTQGLVGAIEKLAIAYEKVKQSQKTVSEVKLQEIQQRLKIEDPREK